ncbi:hypothetical protein [Sphingomonas xinjiangensis]|uniref:Uncharacterized protein n=1 Tax=Sphingomonas xinjiangensis TaxID=643568 RepID=A0A840YM08_9SPHN|nr:hypothetical protein [Sphingomonas xinjiangensis]MBB5710460.1 hypothetical protein [Sphingomonas xinjiangensis]
MLNILKTLVIGAAVIAAPAMAVGRDSPDVQMQKLLANRTAGKPVSCISLTRARSSEIIPGRAIVYRVGGTLYVNQPRSGAESLDDDSILVTRTIGTQLCRGEAVNLVDRGSRFQRGFVLLDDFVPYTKAKSAR